MGFVSSALEEGGKVLIHCKHGASRTAALGIAFLMLHDCMSLHDSALHVKTQRPCVRPNCGFCDQLVELDQALSKKAEALGHSWKPCTFSELQCIFAGDVQILSTDAVVERALWEPWTLAVLEWGVSAIRPCLQC